MAILKPVVVPAKALKDGRHKIRIALSHNSEVRYLLTDIIIDDIRHFKSGQIVKLPDAAYLNTKLRGLMTKYQKALDETEYLDGLSCSEVVCLLKNGAKKHSISLKGVFDEFVEYSTAKPSTKATYATNFSSISKCIDPNMLVKNIRHTTVLEVDRQLRTRGLKPGTRCVLMSLLASLIRHARRCGYLDGVLDPFNGYRFPEKETRQSWLTVDQVRAIRDFDTQTKGQSLARDLFMLSYYLGGINMADLIKINFKEHPRRIQYIRTKTERLSKQNRYVEFDIPDEAMEIIGRRMADDGRIALSEGQRKHRCLELFKQHLGKISQTLDIPNLVFYSARKSFSQHAFDLGVSPAVIDYILGHKIAKQGMSLYSYVYVTPEMATKAIRLVLDNLK